MASLNRVMLIGYLGADPDLRQFQNGALCNLRLSTDESFTDRDGKRHERTEWHSIVVNGRMADTCSQYLHKGSMVFVEGRLTTRKWQDKNGQDRYTTEIRADRIQFLDRKSEPKQDKQYDRYTPSEQQPMDDVPF